MDLGTHLVTDRKIDDNNDQSHATVSYSDSRQLHIGPYGNNSNSGDLNLKTREGGGGGGGGGHHLVSSIISDLDNENDNDHAKDKKDLFLDGSRSDIIPSSRKNNNQNNQLPPQKMFWVKFLGATLVVYLMTLIQVATYLPSITTSKAYFIFVTYSFQVVSGVSITFITYHTRLKELVCVATPSPFFWVAVGSGLVCFGWIFLVIVCYGFSVSYYSASQVWTIVVAIIVFFISIVPFRYHVHRGHTNMMMMTTTSSLQGGDGKDEVLEEENKSTYSYGMFWSIIVFVGLWYFQYIFVTILTDTVIENVQNGGSSAMDYIIFHVAAICWSTLLRFVSKKIQKPGDIKSTTMHREMARMKGKHRRKGVLFQQILQKNTTVREIWWVFYASFGCDLLWSMFHRTLYLSVGSVDQIVILALISGLFSLVFSVGGIIRGFIDFEKRLGHALPMLVGCIFPKLETDIDYESVQRRRYHTFLLKGLTQFFTLCICFPLHSITHAHATKRFPTVSGYKAGVKSEVILLGLAVIFVVEIFQFILAEGIFYALVPKFSMKATKEFQKTLCGHEIIYWVFALHLMTLVVGNLASSD